jgi:hypothetical protein
MITLRDILTRGLGDQRPGSIFLISTPALEVLSTASDVLHISTQLLKSCLQPLPTAAWTS